MVKLHFYVQPRRMETLTPSAFGFYVVEGHHGAGLWFHGLVSVEALAPVLFPASRSEATVTP